MSAQTRFNCQRAFCKNWGSNPGKVIFGLILIASALSVLAACTSGGGDDNTPAQSPAAESESVVPSTVVNYLEPLEGIANGSPIPVEGYRQLAPTTIDVYFAAGDTGCFGYQTVVKEDTDTVTLGVIEGPRSEEEVYCEAVSVPAALQVELLNPIGSRTVVVAGVERR